MQWRRKAIERMGATPLEGSGHPSFILIGRAQASAAAWSPGNRLGQAGPAGQGQGAGGGSWDASVPENELGSPHTVVLRIVLDLSQPQSFQQGRDVHRESPPKALLQSVPTTHWILR